MRCSSLGYSVSRTIPDLRAKNLISGKHDRRAPKGLSQFLAKAWKLANDNARELGWIT